MIKALLYVLRKRTLKETCSIRDGDKQRYRIKIILLQRAEGRGQR